MRRTSGPDIVRWVDTDWLAGGTMRAIRWLLVITAVGAAVSAAPVRSQPPIQQSLRAVAPNDNRSAGGSMVDGILEIHLVADMAAWWIDDRLGTVPVQAFAEAGGAPRIPGPLLRVPEGTPVHVTVENRIPDRHWWYAA